MVGLIYSWAWECASYLAAASESQKRANCDSLIRLNQFHSTIGVWKIMEFIINSANVKNNFEKNVFAIIVH